LLADLRRRVAVTLAADSDKYGAMSSYLPATRPTLYFIGVTTARSSILKVFPAWAAHLGLDADVKGIDFPLDADPRAYREAVAFMRADSLSLGALVTTHKIDLFHACKDLFDDVDAHAATMHEVSCISKREGRLIGHAKDPISGGLSLDGFLPPEHFRRTGANVFAMGAGGSTIALTWHLMRSERGTDVPARIIVSDVTERRLDEVKRVHAAIDSDIPLSYVLVRSPETNDAVVTELPRGSLVINATGLGKDAPGSPLTGAARFPERSIVWDLNYRGDLVFLDQARVEAKTKQLHIEDGWTYFIHGWTQVIAEVFKLRISASGPEFEELARIAWRATHRV
jgi:shikimate 5-dehydrogenase